MSGTAGPSQRQVAADDSEPSPRDSPAVRDVGVSKLVVREPPTFPAHKLWENSCGNPALVAVETETAILGPQPGSPVSFSLCSPITAGQSDFSVLHVASFVL